MNRLVRRVSGALVACAACAGLMLGTPGLAQAKEYIISINQFVEHPSLDASLKGFQDQMKDDGVAVKYHLHNAQGNIATTLQIAGIIVGEKPDVILAIATPSAQATAQKTKDIPILFTATTYPVSAGLVKTMQLPGGNVSGTTDMSPTAKQMELFKSVQPELKRMGVIYNAGEANSKVQVALLKAVSKANNIEVIEAVTPNSAGVYQAAKSLVGRVDAIFLPTDNTVIANMEPIIKVCLENKLPLYPAETDSVKRGGALTVGIDYYRLGRQTAKMAQQIMIHGADVSKMPVEELKDLQLVINLKNAQGMGLKISDELMKKADFIVQ